MRPRMPLPAGYYIVERPDKRVYLVREHMPGVFLAEAGGRSFYRRRDAVMRAYREAREFEMKETEQ